MCHVEKDIKRQQNAWVVLRNVHILLIISISKIIVINKPKAKTNKKTNKKVVPYLLQFFSFTVYEGPLCGS